MRIHHCVLVTFIFCSQVLADDSYIYNELYYVSPDSARMTPDDGVGIRLGYGWEFRDRWYAELSVAAANLDSGDNANTDFYQRSIGADIRYELGDYRWQPFLLAGLGVVHNDWGPGNEDIDGYANAGIGILSPPGVYGIRLRAEARLNYDGFMGGLTDQHYAAGIVIPLGKPAKTVVEVREVIVERIVYADPPDADLDGILDELDQCPNSLANAAVDATGCVTAAQIITLDGVYFEFASAKLTGASPYMLDKVGSSLQGQPDLSVEIVGHTDSSGSDAYNNTLSQARADSVRDYLVSIGIDGDRIVARGAGEAEPIASNETESGRAANRRVEFRTSGSEINE